MYRLRIPAIALLLSAMTLSACGESREEAMRRQMGYGDDEGNPADAVPKIPADPMRDKLAPLLKELYAADSLPDVREGEVEGEGNYSISNPGVLAIVELRSGLSDGDRAKAIIVGVAEADAFAVRNDAEKYFPEQLNSIKYSFGEDQRDLIRSVYADLRLLEFFASERYDAAVGKLDGDLAAAAKELEADYTGRKDEIWAKWMGVKMYARRVVAYDQPFKPLLRGLRKQFGMKEPEKITWEAAHDAPFKDWAAQIDKDEELFKMVNNVADLQAQTEFRLDTHARWAMEGSDMIPAAAKDVEIDEEVGYGLHREDLGGGYQEITFIFSKKLKGNKLKEAYLRSLIYRQVFSDFATLSAAGGDFEGGQVPDENDPDYAYCASRMALDGMINDFSDDKPLLKGLEAQQTDEDKLVTEAVECILVRIDEGINRGYPGDEARPPAPATRNAFFQMLARFTKVDVNLDNMRKDTEKSQDVLDAEAFLKEFDDERKKEMRQ